MSIEAYLTRISQDVITCRPEDTAEAAARLLATNHIGAMPVRNEQTRMVGIISERDLVRAFAEQGCGVAALRVGDLMTGDVITCRPSDSMAHARWLMSKHGFRHLPVVENEKVIGMLSIRDVLENRLEQRKLEVNVLRDSVVAARYR